MAPTHVLYINRPRAFFRCGIRLMRGTYLLDFFFVEVLWFSK